METLFSIIASALAVYIGSMLLSGVRISGFGQSFIVILVLALLNIFLGPLLKVFSLGLLALGIFKWVLDAILIMVASYFLDRFEVRNFWWALALAALVSFLETGLFWLFV